MVIERTGATIQDVILDYRRGVASTVLDVARRAVQRDAALGKVNPATIRAATLVGSTRRQLSGLDADPASFPMPPYALDLTGDDPTAIADVLSYLVGNFSRLAPRGGNHPKNHRWRYADSLVLVKDMRPMNAIPKPTAIDPDATYAAIATAPYASRLEAQYSDGLMIALARDAIDAFPGASINFRYINSDQIGLSYGPGTGGPSSGAKVYQLPAILVTGQGSSGIRINRRRKTRSTKRRT